MLTKEDVQTLRVRLMLIEALTAMAVTAIYVPANASFSNDEAVAVKRTFERDLRVWFDKIAAEESGYEPAILERESLRLLQGLDQSVALAADRAVRRNPLG